MGSRNKKQNLATPKRPVPLSTLENQLPDQLDFLWRSMGDYDKGHTSEYRRMATTIRVLVHSAGRSTSLLEQLALEGSDFISYASPIDDKNLLVDHSLAMMKLSNEGVQYVPKLNKGANSIPHLLSLPNWLQEPILRDAERRKFNRWDFIRVIANQDGGAHVDPKVDVPYAKLQEGETLGWYFGGPDGESKIVEIERCYMRHIAFEMVSSLDAAWAKYIRNKLCQCGSGRKARYCCLKG